MPKFINSGGPFKIRIGEPGEGCYWKTIKTNEVVDLPAAEGKRKGLTELKTTEGQMGSEKVETKQLENYTPDDTFFKELTKIKGHGKLENKDN